MLHAGINHILGNVTIQLLISGHLEFSWGITNFLVVYFSSGIVGYMLSCCLLYSSISVGSSGSIMGILTAWLMDIMFCILTLQSEHDVNVTEIYNQFIMFCAILIAVTLTLALSFESSVDWGSHSGGCFYGFLWGCFLFSDRPKKEAILVHSIIHDSAINLKQPLLKTMIRTVSSAILFCTPLLLLIYMNAL
jgi:membrane associated rhomboid family serine protease